MSDLETVAAYDGIKSKDANNCFGNAVEQLPKTSFEADEKVFEALAKKCVERTVFADELIENANTRNKDILLNLQHPLAISWTPNVPIPFADEENQKIMQELQELVDARQLATEMEQQSIERISKLEFHAKNYEMHVTQNLQIIYAYKSDVETEKHISKVIACEQSKLKSDLKNMQKELETRCNYLNSTEQEVKKRKENVLALTDCLKWAKTVLEEWHAAADDSLKGQRLLEKYCQEDEVRFRQQDSKRQKLENKLAQTKKELILRREEQKTLELNIEAVANMYRSAHLERRAMVANWKKAVQQMMQRERDIEDTEKELLELTTEAKKADEQKEKRNRELNTVLQTNRDIEAIIEELNAQICTSRESIDALSRVLMLKEINFELLQKEIQNQTHQVQQQRLENRNLEAKKCGYMEELEKQNEVLGKLNERYAHMQNKNMSSVQRLQILDNMLDMELKAQHQLEIEYAKTNTLKHRTRERVEELNGEIKVLQLQKESLIAAISSTKQNIKLEAAEVKRQTEIYYNESFRCLEIERLIIKLDGGLFDIKQEQRNLMFLEELEEKYAITTKHLQSTEIQNNKVNYNMRTLMNAYTETNKHLEDLNFTIKEATAYCQGGMSQLKNDINNSQILIVDLSLLKIRIQEFNKEISRTTDERYNLERHRIELTHTIKDRLAQVKCQLDVLNCKRKHLLEERSTLRADISDRKKRIEVIAARFDLSSKLLGTNDDGTLISSTQMKVQLAQEKEMLITEGDLLNKQVLKTEQEIKAFENTVLIMNNANHAYKQSFQPENDEDGLLSQLNELKTEYCILNRKLKVLRLENRRREKHNQSIYELRDDLIENREHEIQKRQATEEILAKVQKELVDQQVKLERAERDMKQALRLVKLAGIGKECIALYDMELDLQELENRNLKALNMLGDLAQCHDNLQPTIVRLLDERSIRLPHIAAKSRSSVSLGSEISFSSAREFAYTTSPNISSSSSLRSSSSTNSITKQSDAASARLSIVSIDFPH